MDVDVGFRTAEQLGIRLSDEHWEVVRSLRDYYLHHEPGAYAHNRFYAKRLLFDSIDWIDNYLFWEEKKDNW